MSCQVFGCVCLCFFCTGSCLHAVNCCGARRGPRPSAHCPPCSAGPATRWVPLLFSCGGAPTCGPPPHSPRTPDVWLGLSVTPQRPSSSPPGLPVITLERPGDVAPQAFTYLATLPRPHWSPFSYTTLHAPLTLAYFFLILRLSPCPYHLSLSFFAPHSCCKSRHGTCEEALGPPRTFSPETPLPRVCFSPLWGPRSSLAPPCCLSVCLSVCSFPCPSPRAASADGFGPGV